ncbi:MAG: hypothetical protein Fur0024_1640 [Patescibacteria group bacterium]
MFKFFKNILGIIFLAPLFLPFSYKIWFRPFGISFNLMEIFIAISFLTFAVLEIFGEEDDKKIEQNVSWTMFGVGWFLMFFGFIISIIVSPNKVDALGIFKSWFIIPSIFGNLIFKFSRSKNRLVDLIVSFGIGAIILNLILLVGGVFLESFWQENRLKGFYESPNYVAMFLTPIFSFFAIQSIFSQSKSLKIFSFAISILSFVSIILTKSRGGILLLLVPIIFFIIEILQNFLQKKLHFSQNKNFKIYIFSAISVIFVSIFSLSKIWTMERFKSSDNVRKLIWMESVEMLKENPIKGIGLANFQDEFRERTKDRINFKEFVIPNALHSHNTFLTIYLELSIFGFTGFLLFVFGFLIYITNFLGELSLRKKNFELDQNENFEEISSIIFFQVFLKSVLVSVFSILLYGMVDSAIWKNDLALQFAFLVSTGMLVSANWEKFDL